jgi:hypothetical protein
MSAVHEEQIYSLVVGGEIELGAVSIELFHLLTRRVGMVKVFSRACMSGNMGVVSDSSG